MVIVNHAGYTRCLADRFDFPHAHCLSWSGSCKDCLPMLLPQGTVAHAFHTAQPAFTASAGSQDARFVQEDTFEIVKSRLATLQWQTQSCQCTALRAGSQVLRLSCRGRHPRGCGLQRHPEPVSRCAAACWHDGGHHSLFSRWPGEQRAGSVQTCAWAGSQVLQAGESGPLNDYVMPLALLACGSG